MKFLKANLILVLILLLATILRFYNLGKTPPSLNWDETAHGYNAYSILKTARDEYGYKLPLYFRSFDDYKPPLYTYLVVPTVAIFGLNNFAVRFPSAFLGVFAVLFTYLMVLELFKNKKIALLAAFFLAISPWHLQFSRVAFETNSSIFFFVTGTWAFLKGIHAKSRISIWFCLSAFVFGLNLYIYHNARVVTPLFILVLAILYREKLLAIKKQLILPIIIGLIFAAPLLWILTSEAGQFRYKGVAVFYDLSPQYHASDLIHQDEETGQLFPGKLFHNRRLIYLPIVIENYFSHWKLTYLFFTSDLDRHHAPEMAMLYYWDLPFVLAGIYFLIKNKFPIKSKWIIFAWFLIAPIPSAVTYGVPHSLRSEIYLPTYQIFIAVAVYTFFLYAKRKRLFVTIAAVTLMLNFLFYVHQYYIHTPLIYSEEWLYGRKEAALFTESIKDKYDRIIVSTKLEQPHEFWLYYLKYDPKKYQQDGGTVSGGFLEDRNKFDKYQFRPIDFKVQSQENAKTLFVGTPKEFPESANIIKKIYYLNGEPALYIVEGQDKFENSN